MHDDDLQLREDELRRLGYDPRDVNIPVIRRAVIGFLTFSTAAVIASIGIYVVLVPWHCAGPQPTAQVPPTRIPPAPNPLLQTELTAKTDIAEMIKRQDAALNSFGWLEKSKGRVHIPIDQAIEMTLQKGLPTKVTTEGEKTTIIGESR